MKQRKGRRLISETESDSGKDGPIVAGEFPTALWAFVFKHFERRVPPRIAIEQTKWRGFRNWPDAVAWLEEGT